MESLIRYEDNYLERIIIVDNYGLLDYSTFFEAGGGKVLVVNPGRNLGFGRGVNLAMKYVETPYILLQNPDTELEGEILSKMLDFLKEHGGAVVPMAKTPNGIELLARRYTKVFDIMAGRRSPLLKLKFFKKLGERYRYFDKLREKNPFEVDAFTGTFVLMSKQVFNEVSGFDERYFLFMEDVDLSRRIKQAGYRITVFPDIYVKHLVGATRGRAPLKSGFAKAKSVYLYLAKWHEVKGVIKYFVGLLLGLYTILVAFLNFIDFQRPELSWKRLSKERH